ncbi:adenylate/guanylate cyclase domain-containing protein [Tardiphaga sp. P9-11]|jgi:adenylate cyclase|uniref:adenylate/guanylate cyclase domain-containing protein n=1 Tax=Tardiphaga sp. P9-11 TaxID=2024614 RepID=UPI0011F0A57C|nr:adenylate/guanylate cyclase domain-containing protein [Tardiphaga sp. P9-11]KAA0073560.1 adenylate/guanylate cyclase domain-containing protein [Tardiphaga sp. P9-11]
MDATFKTAGKPPGPTRATAWWRSVGLRQIRLVCGLVLFAYLLSHFLNHALGNISLDALQAGVIIHAGFWQSFPVAEIFYSAVTIHGVLGIWALYERRQFRWRAIEPLQLVLGLSIPALIVAHVVAIRLGQNLFDIDRSYPQVFYSWITSPWKTWSMYLVVLVSWLHGCIGLYFWLRLKSYFKAVAPYLLAAAVLIPTLALLGIFQGKREVEAKLTSPQWQAANLNETRLGTEPQQQTLGDLTDRLLIGYAALLAIVLAARGIRQLAEQRAGMINLAYGDGRKIRVPTGLSVLEASLRHRVPHASVCGGRARCSTCRIRITSDIGNLPAPSAREAFILNRIGTGADPAVRLACQLRPTTDVAFVQLFAPQVTSANAHASQPARIGQERYLVCMFVDMRGSTMLAEKRLPYDTVFIVNRFLDAVSQAVIASGGQPNQFIGDGELALFGLACDPQTACRQALQAARLIAENIDELNRALAHDLPQPLRFGIGIHGGEVIVGDIGYRDHMVFTALGDAVNVAARLQDMTKSLACEVIISEEVSTTAGLAGDALPQQDVAIRGRAAPMNVRTIADARVLPSLVTSDVAPAL